MENVSEKGRTKEMETLEKISARKQHQAVMTWAGCAKETQQFIEKIPDGLLCELLYLCALDGMPLQEIKKMFSHLKGTSREKADIIWKERQRYLQKLYGETSKIAERIESLYQEAKQVFLESKKVQKSVEKHMTYTLDMQKNLLAEQKEANIISLSSKDEVIQEKEKQIQRLEQEVKSLQKTETSLREENRQIRKKLLEQETEKAAPIEEKILLQKNVDPASQKPEEKANIKNEQEPPCRNGFRDFFRKNRRKKESREFIEIFLSDKDYSQEQREYLLRCLEEGDSVREIQQFASSKLTVEQMERMRRMNSR